MVDVLLLHGMCVESSEWERVIPALEADPRIGRVIAPDMPGRGRNRPRDHARIRLSDYTATAIAALGEHDLRDTIVVGHSGGGIYLQAAVAAEPHRVRRIAFLASAVPERGKSVLDLQPLPLRLCSRGFMKLFQAERLGIRANKRMAKRSLCHDVRDEDCGLIADRLVPEPQALIVDRIDWNPERVNAPATYIMTARDRVLPPKHQSRMIRNVPGARVERLDMGHARPVVEPDALVRLLLTYAA